MRRFNLLAIMLLCSLPAQMNANESLDAATPAEQVGSATSSDAYRVVAKADSDQAPPLDGMEMSDCGSGTCGCCIPRKSCCDKLWNVWRGAQSQLTCWLPRKCDYKSLFGMRLDSDHADCCGRGDPGHGFGGHGRGCGCGSHGNYRGFATPHCGCERVSKCGCDPCSGCCKPGLLDGFFGSLNATWFHSLAGRCGCGCRPCCGAGYGGQVHSGNCCCGRPAGGCYRPPCRKQPFGGWNPFHKGQGRCGSHGSCGCTDSGLSYHSGTHHSHSSNGTHHPHSSGGAKNYPSYRHTEEPAPPVPPAVQPEQVAPPLPAPVGQSAYRLRRLPPVQGPLLY